MNEAAEANWSVYLLSTHTIYIRTDGQTDIVRPRTNALGDKGQIRVKKHKSFLIQNTFYSTANVGPSSLHKQLSVGQGRAQVTLRDQKRSSVSVSIKRPRFIAPYYMQREFFCRCNRP